MLEVTSIEKGIVIDHIKAGFGIQLFNYLKLDNAEYNVALIINAFSKKQGRKDIIKINNEIDIDYNFLGLLDPNITINVIENGKIKEKVKLKVPTRVVNVIKCKNPRCITSTEQELKHVFRLTDRVNKVYRCIYCETKAG